jgi:hypothetical protein
VPLTPDRRPGVLEEDEAIKLGPQAVTPTVNGEFRYVTGVGFRFFEEGSTEGLGVSETEHRALLQLIHFIDGGPAEGFTTGATRTTTGTAFPSQILWRRADATKLVEKNLTYTGAFPTTIQWKVYAADGTTVLATVTDTITYSGAFETGRTRAIV